MKICSSFGNRSISASSFTKIMKKRGLVKLETTIERVKKIETDDDLIDSQNSIEKFLYFYSPYNRKIVSTTSMKFDDSENISMNENSPLSCNGSRSRSQWRHLSKIILGQNQDIFEQMIRSFQGHRVNNSVTKTNGGSAFHRQIKRNLKSTNSESINFPSDNKIDEVSNSSKSSISMNFSEYFTKLVTNINKGLVKNPVKSLKLNSRLKTFNK